MLVSSPLPQLVGETPWGLAMPSAATAEGRGGSTRPRHSWAARAADRQGPAVKLPQVWVWPTDTQGTSVTEGAVGKKMTAAIVRGLVAAACS